MSVKNIKVELAATLNYQFNQNLNIVYGQTDEYTSIFAPFDQYESSFNITFCVSKDGSELKKEEFSNLKAENKIITNIRVDKYRVIFTIKGSMKQEDKLNNILEANKIIVNYLKENDYKNIDEHTKQFCNTTICNVKGKPAFITPETLQMLKNENEGEGAIKKEENVVKGIIGGILGSLVGVLAIVLIGQLGYIAIISGIIMGACTILAYGKFAGVMSKKGIVISVIIMIIMTYIGVRLDATITISNEFSKYYASIDFMQIFGNVDNIVKLDATLESAYMRDMILTYVFTGLGAVGMIMGKLQELKNGNVYEVL